MPPLNLRRIRSEEHTSELQSHVNLVCRLLLEKKKKIMVIKNLKRKDVNTFNEALGYEALMKKASLTDFELGDRPGALLLFFFNDTATTEIYTLSLHDALPI